MARSVVRYLLVVIVTDPGFEQITQNVQRISALGILDQKAKKTPGGNRAFVGQMQIGDAEGATRAGF